MCPLDLLPAPRLSLRQSVQSAKMCYLLMPMNQNTTAPSKR